MKKLEIKGNKVFLDGEEVECLKGFKLVSSVENKRSAELTLTIDVKIDQVET